MSTLKKRTKNIFFVKKKLIIFPGEAVLQVGKEAGWSDEELTSMVLHEVSCIIIICVVSYVLFSPKGRFCGAGLKSGLLSGSAWIRIHFSS